ncbi:MAG: LPS assembly lipoprotein LptE [Methylotenera sp.]
MLKLSLRALLYIVLVASLIGCGFHLRGTTDLSFNSIFIQGNTLVISKNLNKTLHTNGVKVLDSAESAELLLEMVGEESEKRILSLSGRGKVNEFELYYRVHYRAKLAGAELWSPVQTIESRRDFSYSDANLLAKQGEEKRLNEGMQQDVISGLMRRLSALKK